ncbi:MAG: Rrf2 family transcriptional regulator [Akkermansiaceae bacterium]|nr:Rrf2 family transcriptional regulator [Akkermansiaceae bacterium]
MKQDGRLARMIHVIVHMGLLDGRETSETIGRMLNTHPVVVRRTMGMLKASGIVGSESGRGGGWKLLRTLDQITVLDVQRALSETSLLPPGISGDHPACPVERATNAALIQAFARAEEVLSDRFSELSLSAIAAAALAGE